MNECNRMDISIIIPIHNGANWIQNCMNSIENQTMINGNHNIEIVACDDGSVDNTFEILESWREKFDKINVKFKIVRSDKCRGVGAAKNVAVRNSSGQYLCFQDIDDIMKPERLRLQLIAAQSNPTAIVGSKISRVPENSTPRLADWANNLDPTQLKLQIYTSHGPTLLMPTWFCHKQVFQRVGGFSEAGRGTPEDLIFFYSHLDQDGDLVRVDEDLLIYTYHEGATTFSICREIIFKIQLERLERDVLSKWKQFTIWNAGKAGRKTVRALCEESQQKVNAFCDVDCNKIGQDVELFCAKRRKVFLTLPVLHFTEAKPPFLVCVKLGLTNGDFEKNLKSLNLTEGKDYVMFN